MFKTLSLAVLLASAVILSGCTGVEKDFSFTYNADSGIGVEEKEENTQIRGDLIEENDKYYLLLDDDEQVEINSYTIPLNNYKNQRATLTGEYHSGVFLVREIEQ